MDETVTITVQLQLSHAAMNKLTTEEVFSLFENWLMHESKLTEGIDGKVECVMKEPDK